MMRDWRTVKQNYAAQHNNITTQQKCTYDNIYSNEKKNLMCS